MFAILRDKEYLLMRNNTYICRFNSERIINLCSYLTKLLARMCRCPFYETQCIMLTANREAAAGPRRRLMHGCSTDDLEQLPDELPPITVQDFDAAVVRTKPTVSREVVEKHETWNDKFGCF